MTLIPHRLLIVDDDPDIGMMIKTMLEYHGYTVTVIEQAEHTIDMLLSGQYDLLVMDMLLSGMNGTDICRELKKQVNIPVIMISAHPNAREACLDAGADDFLAKPFDMQELLSKVSKNVKISTAS